VGGLAAVGLAAAGGGIVATGTAAGGSSLAHPLAIHPRRTTITIRIGPLV
jgi:hypothetical protein